MHTPRSAWFIYIALRLLFFAVPFAVLMLLGIWPWLSAVFAALIGVSLSIILLAKPRATASESIYAWRNRDRTADDVIEDDAIDTNDAANSVDVADATDAAETADPAGDPIGDPATHGEQGARS